MIGNILGVFVLAVWVIFAILYIWNQKKNERKTGVHMCIGCSACKNGHSCSCCK